MRIVVAVILSVLALVGCGHRVEHVAGIYEMIRMEGKPLPFMGVRGGELYLRPDGTFTAFTHRAVVVGGSAVRSDSVAGVFGIRTWRGPCVGMWMEAANLEEGPRIRVTGEICGDTLFSHYDGGVFRKTKIIKTSGSGGSPPET